MITVMFPTGVRVTYNDANEVQWYPDRVEILYKDNKGQRYFRATAPIGTYCLIEWGRPCEVTAAPVPTADAAIDELLRKLQNGEAKSVASWKLKGLKRALAKFNARSECWRD